MASIYDIAGTSNSSFTIGNDGITLLYGNTEPKDYLGKVGDIYVQVNTILNPGAEEDTKLFGRFYYKNVRDDKVVWDFIKNYSFDEPIIKSLETNDGSNNFKISIQKALQPSNTPSSTESNDFNVAHDNYGIVRFSTNDEAKNGTRNDIVVNPYQLIWNINDLIQKHNVSTDCHADIRKSIADEIDRATNAEKVLQENIDKEENSRIDADNNLQSQIDTINARKDVVDVVGTIEELKSYDTRYLTDKDIVKVLSDSTENDRQTYYRWVIDGNVSKWEFVGSDSASYTKAEIDEKEATINQRIDNEVDTLNTRIDNEVDTLNNTISSNVDTLNTRIDNEVDTLNTRIDNEVKDLEDAIDLKSDIESPTFTGTPKLIINNETNESSPLATEKFVNNGLDKKQDTIVITPSDSSQFLSNDGNKLEWKVVEDISYLKDLHDTNISTPLDGEVIIYNEQEEKWVNGRQTTATIKYW